MATETTSDQLGAAANQTPEKDARKVIDHLFADRLTSGTISDLGKAVQRAKGNSAIGNFSGNRRAIPLDD